MSRKKVYIEEDGTVFTQPDHTYREIQERSFQQWLNEMEHHPDLAVSGGVRLAREYVQYLKEEIKRQEASNQLKADYMCYLGINCFYYY